MSFSATLYNCPDDPRKLNKNLPANTAIEVSSITPTDSCDILNPTFILNYNSSYTTKNYIVVSSPFNRSYFITDMKIDIGKKIVISCAVDVLQTYKDEIKKINANIVRNENLIKDMLPDPNFVYLNENDVINKLITPHQGTNFFGDQLTKNGFYYILGISGSANTHGGDVDGFTLLTAQPSDWSIRYMFYWLNTGTTHEPNMQSIGSLISQGILPQGEPSYSNLVQGYGGVYQKNQS